LSTHGNWVKISAVANGRADATNANPIAGQEYREIGSCIEDQGAGTDILAEVILS